MSATFLDLFCEGLGEKFSELLSKPTSRIFFIFHLSFCAFCPRPSSVRLYTYQSTACWLNSVVTTQLKRDRRYIPGFLVLRRYCELEEQVTSIISSRLSMFLEQVMCVFFCLCTQSTLCKVLEETINWCSMLLWFFNWFPDTAVIWSRSSR